MSGHFWLTEEQMERLRPFFPRSRGKPRVDDRRVLSGIVYVKRNGLQWKDTPSVYGPPKTLYNRFVRLKDWLRIATRYDRCGELFLSAICIATIIMFWL